MQPRKRGVGTPISLPDILQARKIAARKIAARKIAAQKIAGKKIRLPTPTFERRTWKFFLCHPSIGHYTLFARAKHTAKNEEIHWCIGRTTPKDRVAMT